MGSRLFIFFFLKKKKNKPAVRPPPPYGGAFIGFLESMNEDIEMYSKNTCRAFSKIKSMWILFKGHLPFFFEKEKTFEHARWKYPPCVQAKPHAGKGREGEGGCTDPSFPTLLLVKGRAALARAYA